MADDNNPAPDGGGDPNTPEQLRIARADAKAAREDAQRYRTELTTLRGELTRKTGQLEEQIEAMKTSHASEVERVTLDLTAKANAAKSDAETRTAAAQKHVTMTELRQAAKEAGMKDFDGLRLLELGVETEDGKKIDFSSLKVDKSGVPTNAKEIVDMFLVAKPHFLAAARPGTSTGTTTSTVRTPEPAKPGAFNARTATKEDVQARMREMTGGAVVNF